MWEYVFTSDWNIQKIKESNESTSVERHVKKHISRRDYLVIIDAAFTTCLRFVIYVCLVGFTALRTYEAVQVQVGDFELDANGLLKDVGRGFGLLSLPAYKLKGGYPVEKCRIAVVPQMREIINDYLEMDFMKFNTPATYISRHKPVREYDELYDNVPDHKDSMGYALWIKKASLSGEAIMSEISEKIRFQLETKIHGNAGITDLRRSICDWIKETPNSLPPNMVNRISETHLRHVRRDSKDFLINEPSFEEYMECVDTSLNFPWDLPSLEIWESVHKL